MDETTASAGGAAGFARRPRPRRPPASGRTGPAALGVPVAPPGHPPRARQAEQPPRGPRRDPAHRALGHGCDATKAAASSVGDRGLQVAKRGGAPPRAALSAPRSRSAPPAPPRCLHSLDARAARARSAELHHRRDRVRGPFEHRLHRAVAAVAHPARHPPGRASRRIVSRKNTPWTCPCTTTRRAGGLAHTSSPPTSERRHSRMEASAQVASPPGASTRNTGSCSTSCSARRTTSAGCPRARSRAPRSTRGLIFSREDAQRQHAEMVSVYEEAGVRVHFLEPDPALPYQVFARDSSINVLRRADRHPVRPVVAPRRVRPRHPLLPGRAASRSSTWSRPARSRAATS